MTGPSNDTTAKPTAVPKRKLGRGLGALMGEIRKEEPVSATEFDNQRDSVDEGLSGNKRTGGLHALPIADIEPLPDQPRTRFDESALDELAASIAARGVIQPIIVTPHEGGKYRLVAGERRWRAAQRAQLQTIPAIVRELKAQEVVALALIENLQREDLNPLEEARAYQRLTQHEDMTQAGIAKLVDKSRSHVANILRLLALPTEVQKLVESGELSMGHARALIGHEDAGDLAQEAVSKKLSVRDVEKRVRKNNGGPDTPRRKARPSRNPADDADIAAVQNHLEEFLGLPVTIKADHDPRSGAVTIKYRTLDQLDLVCQRLTGGEI